MEPSDYAVWRAANAMVDIWILIIQEDIHSKLNNEKDLTRREIDQKRALVEAGCLQLSQTNHIKCTTFGLYVLS